MCVYFACAPAPAPCCGCAACCMALCAAIEMCCDTTGVGTYQLGMSFLVSPFASMSFSSFSVKLKSGGRGRPLGSLRPGSRSSSKNGCASDSSGVVLSAGLYRSHLLIKSIALSPALFLKTLAQG